MAKITLKDLSHSYLSKQSSDADWALRGVDIDWKDGGAYALLGPSGCGKTTLLNIISGLLKPTKGEILFDDKNVTALNPVERDIAQIFQFPVIYALSLGILVCLLYTSPSPRDLSTSRMPSSA